MHRFIHRENVRHLEDLLTKTDDARERKRLLDILEEEKTSLLAEEMKVAGQRDKAS